MGFSATSRRARLDPPLATRPPRPRLRHRLQQPPAALGMESTAVRLRIIALPTLSNARIAKAVGAQTACHLTPLQHQPRLLPPLATAPVEACRHASLTALQRSTRSVQRAVRHVARLPLWSRLLAESVSFL